MHDLPNVPNFVTTICVVADVNYFGENIKDAHEAAKREFFNALRDKKEVEFSFNTYEVSVCEETYLEYGDDAIDFKYPPLETRASYL